MIAASCSSLCPMPTLASTRRLIRNAGFKLHTNSDLLLLLRSRAWRALDMVSPNRRFNLSANTCISSDLHFIIHNHRRSVTVHVMCFKVFYANKTPMSATPSQLIMHWTYPATWDFWAAMHLTTILPMLYSFRTVWHSQREIVTMTSLRVADAFWVVAGGTTWVQGRAWTSMTLAVGYRWTKLLRVKWALCNNRLQHVQSRMDCANSLIYGMSIAVLDWWRVTRCVLLSLLIIITTFIL